MTIRLDMGCGINRHKDCNVGLDKHDFSEHYEEGGFIQHDVLTPLPFDDCSVDWIYCHHLFEHLVHRHPTRDMDTLIFVVNEFQRVLKFACEAFIVVPWLEHTNAWRHPTHYRHFDESYFRWFHYQDFTPDWEAEGLLGKWGLVENRIQDECHIIAVLMKMR